MTESFRSKFENMVFNSTTTATPPPGAMTGTSLYGWFRKHPTSTPSNPCTVANTTDPVHVDIPHPVFKRKFEMERLFEVVTMYLFNGLKPSHTQLHKTYRHKDTTSLLHYLAYVVPEADKLHVVDLDTHSGHFERIRHVRILFDAEDYKFRVVVNKGKENGWQDLSIPLRIYFTQMLKRIVPHGTRNIKDSWVDIATTFRTHLVDMMQQHTQVDMETLDTWILRPEDIQWETDVYAAGGVKIREMLDASDGIQQFLVSYWSDNYLEFEGYKLARLFNGLVGYGEFIFDYDNNYSRKATNNFFFPDETSPGGKKWLWSDLPETTHGKICNTAERSNMLEAIIQGGKLYITDEFRLMVYRRHVDATEDVSRAALAVVVPLIVTPTFADEEMTSRTEQSLMDHIDSMFKGLFDPVTAKLHDSIDQVGGTLDSDILKQLTESFMEKCYDISKNTADSSFNANTIVDKNVAIQVVRMVKIYIHTAREKWLLEQHTAHMPSDLLQQLRDMYTSDFWKAGELDDVAWPELNPGRAKTLFLESLNSIEQQNNSSLTALYEDPVTTTHGVGYLHAARKNNCACNPFGCGLSDNILQGYYDRKVQGDVTEFMSSCDLTSILRSTQTLVRGLEKFMECMQRMSKKPHKGSIFGTTPILKTTRSPYAANGCYYVLEGQGGVYGTVENESAGNRPVHADDLVTFAHTLFSIVQNPGIWNMLNTRAEKELEYTPQVANIGFVQNGTSIINGSVQDKPSWAGISYMTFTKLRVGVMDQPNVPNTANRYVNELLNNTRRITGQTIQHAFKSFMFKIYKSQAFINSFYPSVKDASDAERLHDLKVNTSELQQFIKSEASDFIDRLHQCCKDSNLQVTSPNKPNYAFPALREHNILLPTDGIARKSGEKDTLRHLQIFYIVFGETLCSISSDLNNVTVCNINVPQELQVSTNKLVAQRLDRQILKFLKNITTMFFEGDLHHSLVHQLKQRTPKKAIPATLDMSPGTHKDLNWTFEMIRSNLAGALLQLRHVPVLTTLETMAWKGRSPSAKATEQAIVRLLAPLTESERKIEFERKLNHSQMPDEAASWADMMDRHKSPEKDEHIAKLTFRLYVDVYSQISSYYDAGSANPNKKSGQNFHENRMLVMRICEEQMHLVQRHRGMDNEYTHSRAWELLFSMFMHQQQLFAELEPEKSGH
jgi:hypothetical protein